MNKITIWRVAVPTPLSNYFDYLPCDTTSNHLIPGVRVKVPFGKRTIIGILLAISDNTAVEFDKLKQAIEVLDEEPVLDAHLLNLCDWVSRYYHHPIGEVLMTALPKHLRSGKSIRKKDESKIIFPLADRLRLNSDQKKAVEMISQGASFTTFLLAGVTGSGKTEVYLQVIADILKRGKQALILVPEISLTPQTLERFQRRFSVTIAVMHSGMTDRERAIAWWQAKKGDASILIGTRSAVFAPLENVGIIIVDEEHDGSFKSQSQMRYSARDIAVVRARMKNIPVVLGSATPSLESYFNVVCERYRLLTLPSRAGLSVLPKVRIVDIRKQPLQGGLSQPLISAIENQLEKGKQVLLFVNRRGYAPVMICHQCGHIVNCSRCDAKMTLHTKPERLICHHCDKVIPPIRDCPVCQKAELISLGQGTEQLESVLSELFPQHKILRVDKDTTKTRHSLEEKLAKINADEVDILIGTQMLAKGHHFPNLSLSAIIDVDGGFFSIDFRAIERMAQLLIQVSGRAGRGDEQGEVIIQTHQPEHPYLALLFKDGYFAFSKALLEERRQAQLPPFSFQAMVRAEALKRQPSIDFLKAAKDWCKTSEVEVFGPMPAMLERRAGRFRHQLLLQSKNRKTLQACLAPLRQSAERTPQARAVRWAIDVDPQET